MKGPQAGTPAPPTALRTAGRDARPTEKAKSPLTPLCQRGGQEGEAWAPRDYTIQAVARAAAVVEWLGEGDFWQWRSIRDVAVGTGLPVATCHGLLETLTECWWVEKMAGRGYRLAAKHLLGILIHMQHYYIGELKKLGVDEI